MSRKLGHPPPAALAGLRAGLPGVRHGRRLCLHVARCPAYASVCAQVYVITVTDKGWVVGIGCTASRPSLITPVQLVPPVEPQAAHSGI
jgi:hypothetical protein